MEHKKIWDILSSVTDPEIPVLTIQDLGIIRDVKINGDVVEVIITPTYSGCPAMDFIAVNIKAALADNDYTNVKITSVLSPAWTTDWMSETAHKKLKAYGIAPPQKGTINKGQLFSEARQVECPQCGSMHTEMISQFGSTACKAYYKCHTCQEPFDYFKCH